MISSFTDRRPPKHKQSAQSYFLSPNSVHFQTGSAACDDNLFHCSQPPYGLASYTSGWFETCSCWPGFFSGCSEAFLHCFHYYVWCRILIVILRARFSTFFFNFLSFFTRNYRKNISWNWKILWEEERTQ